MDTGSMRGKLNVHKTFRIPPWTGFSGLGSIQLGSPPWKKLKHLYVNHFLLFSYSILMKNFTYFVVRISRSSRPEVFCKKGVLKKLVKFKGKYLCQRLFFNKVAWACNFIKIETLAHTFFYRTLPVAASGLGLISSIKLDGRKDIQSIKLDSSLLYSWEEQ